MTDLTLNGATRPSPVLEVGPLGFPWTTFDPFLFCVHHDDHYPRGNAALGPDASLAGRRIGMDFEGKDGWRMYHGDEVPGFPRHPHRGFETVTIARRGFIDHSDSLGATARFGKGDVQWMTAGRGVVHAEMFPLLDRDGPNPTELFQIWLNLPAEDKLVDPHFTMLWGSTLPRRTYAGGAVEVTAVAGSLEGERAPAPPPSSWASRPDSHVSIWTLRLDPGARFTLPASVAGLNRALYFFLGDTIEIADRSLTRGHFARLTSDAAVELVNGPDEAQLVLLEGRPIGEPVVSYGPFVMNSQVEIQRAIIDYRVNEYGGWPWESDGPVHARDAGRFAVHADGRREPAPDA